MGLALFMGSLLAFDVALAVAPQPTGLDFINYAKFVEANARYLSLFGLFLAMGSGAALIALGNFSFARSGWLWGKILLSVALFFNAMFLLVPNAMGMLEFAQKMPKGITPVLIKQIQGLAASVKLSGDIGLGLVIIIAYLGVTKAQAFKIFTRKK
jgi:hypothetical protein